MDKNENNKKSSDRTPGDAGKGRDGCIIIKKGEPLSLKVIEKDLKKCEKKEKEELGEWFSDVKGGQYDEEQ